MNKKIKIAPLIRYKHEYTRIHVQKCIVTLISTLDAQMFIM